MGAQLNIRRHPEVDKTVQALPQRVVDSFKVFERRLKCNGDLSAFINTQPFSPKGCCWKAHPNSALSPASMPACLLPCWVGAYS